MTDFTNRALFTVASAPGTGDISVGAAVSGPYRTLGAAHDGQTFDIAITDGNAWEVRTGCTYTHGTTTLTRGTLEDSSTGSAISLSASTQVMVTAVSSRETFVERLMRGTQPGGRLTLTSGTPVTTSDVTGATTIYYTPYVHDTIVLWDGARWRPVTFAEVSHALGTMTANANYDIFGYLSSGALALEKLAWTNDSTRATVVTIQDGRYCKAGDKTRLYLGTFRSTSTTTTQDSAGGSVSQTGGRRLVWNMYNRVKRSVAVFDSGMWSYGTNTFRRANNASGNQVDCVVGLPSESVSAHTVCTAYLSNNTASVSVAIGIDSATTPSGLRNELADYTPSSYTHKMSSYGLVSAEWNGVLGAGYHFFAWLERGDMGITFFAGNTNLSGLRCELWC